jgi:hypothetical protein
MGGTPAILGFHANKLFCLFFLGQEHLPSIPCYSLNFPHGNLAVALTNGVSPSVSSRVQLSGGASARPTINISMRNVLVRYRMDSLSVYTL